jgi:four helix bundle protein
VKYSARRDERSAAIPNDFCRRTNGTGPASSGTVKPQDLRLRTFDFALEVVRLFRELPRTAEYHEIGRQLLRSANSVASNYRAAGRSRSKAEFVSKLGIVREESDESEHWIQMLTAIGLQNNRLAWLRDEAGQLVAIFAAAYKTATARRGDQVRSRDRAIG